MLLEQDLGRTTCCRAAGFTKRSPTAPGSQRTGFGCLLTLSGGHWRLVNRVDGVDVSACAAAAMLPAQLQNMPDVLKRRLHLSPGCRCALGDATQAQGTLHDERGDQRGPLRHGLLRLTGKELPTVPHYAKAAPAGARG